MTAERDMSIEEFITDKQIEILAYHGPRSSLVDAFVIPADALREFVKGKVLVDAKTIATVVACVAGELAVTRTELDSATADLFQALQPNPESGA